MGDGSASLPLAYCAPSSAYDLKVPMHLRASHFAFSPLVALSSLLLTPAAQAITFERLAANGAGTGIFFTPQASDWIFAPAAGETSVTAIGQGWQIDVGTPSFGTPESGQQSSDIFGAGLLLPSSDHGWLVHFEANLRTWDSYNDGLVVPPNEGGNLGDWDLFSVNANRNDFYWNLVSSSHGEEGGGDGEWEVMPTAMALAANESGSLIDPLLPTRPAGSVVQYTNTTEDPSYLPGSTWAWGGRDYAAGYFESIRTKGNLLVAGGDAHYLSFVLDTRTPYDNDSSFPSWGRFGVAGASDDVPDGEAGEAPGWSYSNPVMPVGVNEDGSFVFDPIEIGEDGLGLDDFLFIDPVVAIGYEFAISGDSKFSEILLPALGDADGYGIEVQGENGEWMSLGSVADGGTFTFLDAVTLFRVVGIDAALWLDPANPVAFITGVKVDAAGTVVFSMTPLVTAVPEPATWALMLAGLLAVGVARRRQA